MSLKRSDTFSIHKVVNSLQLGTRLKFFIVIFSKIYIVKNAIVQTIKEDFMKLLTLTGFLRTSIFALVLMFSVGPVNAQPNESLRTPTTVTDRDYNTTRTTTIDRDHDTNWGWIGLLGLLGLSGLLPKKRTIENDRIDTGNRTPPR